MTWLDQLEAQHVPVHALGVALLLFLFAGLVDFLLQLGFSRTMLRSAASQHPDVTTRLALTRRLTRASLWLLTLSLVASQFETLRTLGTTLLASAGVVGVIVGVAARSTFANVIAGMQIAFTQPIRVGDVVNIRNETGEVEDITLSYTFIKTGDNRRLAIPNDVLSNEVIRNYSLRDPSSLASAQFSVGYHADLAQVKELLLAAARTCAALDASKNVSFGVAELTDAAVHVKLFAWAKTPMDGFDLAGQLLEAGLRALQQAKVPLPVVAVPVAKV
ncbi:MAG: mechanosensitive ion channel [Deltaproteobacteria bacterium]|nr:mechanosensitive ion channel [Deltaproteobacteria bacterium]